MTLNGTNWYICYIGLVLFQLFVILKTHFMRFFSFFSPKHTHTHNQHETTRITLHHIHFKQKMNNQLTSFNKALRQISKKNKTKYEFANTRNLIFVTKFLISSSLSFLFHFYYFYILYVPICCFYFIKQLSYTLYTLSVTY